MFSSQSLGIVSLVNFAVIMTQSLVDLLPFIRIYSFQMHLFKRHNGVVTGVTMPRYLS